MSRKKHLNISNDQLAQIQSEKQIGETVFSSIRVGEMFVRFTLYRDIKKVFFKKEKPRDVSDIQCERIFYKLLVEKFIEQSTSKTQTTIPIYICLKKWSSQSLRELMA